MASTLLLNNFKLDQMKNLTLIILFALSLQSIAQTGCSSPLSDTQFKTEFKKVTSHDFDEAKKGAIESLFGKCLTSAQIKQLLQQLSFEEDKLDLAKKAYSNVSDPANYGIIKSVFDFDDSKKAIDSLMK